MAHGVPHTVGPRQHPYDPDWPDIQLMLANKCLGCHRTGEDLADFSSYPSLRSATVAGDPASPLVVPGNAEQSPFWQSVAWNAKAQAGCELPDAPAMPEEESEWLTAGQLAIVYRWINRGAHEFQPGLECEARPLMETDFPAAKQCAACHPRKYDEWSRSMHAYAQHSPTFAALNNALQERTSGTLGTFCSRCHTPIGTILGEHGRLSNARRSRISMEGVTCVVCHRRAQGHYKSSGRVSIQPGKLTEGCLYGPFEHPALNGPESHPSAPLPYLKSSQFCSECHDVFNPQGVRLEEAFSEWQNSPAANRGITCQICHMGPVQGLPIPESHRPLGRAAVVPGVDPATLPLRRLTDHTFAGPDYSLLPDTEFPHKLDWMYETDYRELDRLTPYQRKTLTDLRHRNRASLRIAAKKRYELLGNSACLQVRHPQHARSGDRFTIRVDVTNKVMGHNFPTGFSAERQVWVTVELFDPWGRIVFASGNLDANGDLRDDHSHLVLAGKSSYDKHLLNFQNKFIALTHKGTERSVVIPVNRHLIPLNFVRPATGIPASFGRPEGFRIAKGSLPPLATRGRDYPITLPAVTGTLGLRVTLNFRHLPPTLLDELGAGALKPLVEVVVLDRYESPITVTP